MIHGTSSTGHKGRGDNRSTLAPARETQGWQGHQLCGGVFLEGWFNFVVPGVRGHWLPAEAYNFDRARRRNLSEW